MSKSSNGHQLDRGEVCFVAGLQIEEELVLLKVSGSWVTQTRQTTLQIDDVAVEDASKENAFYNLRKRQFIIGHLHF